MSQSDTWSIKETGGHVLRIFGEAQYALARPSLNSVADRKYYAHYHYHEAIDLLKKHVDPALEKYSILEIILGREEEVQAEFNTIFARVGANILACIQSIHAVGDILAHAAYFSLGGNLAEKPINPRYISISKVIQRLSAVDKFRPVSDHLSILFVGGAFAHISALANLGKHRSIIRPAIWGDATGIAEEIYALRIPGFEYDGTDFPEVELRPFLEAEYNRCSRLVVDVGNEINAILRSMASPHFYDKS
jgi:hypothetical protein